CERQIAAPALDISHFGWRYVMAGLDPAIQITLKNLCIFPGWPGLTPGHDNRESANPSAKRQAGRCHATALSRSSARNHRVLWPNLIETIAHCRRQRSIHVRIE